MQCLLLGAAEFQGVAGPDEAEAFFGIEGPAFTWIPDFDQAVGEADKDNGVGVVHEKQHGRRTEDANIAVGGVDFPAVNSQLPHSTQGGGRKGAVCGGVK